MIKILELLNMLVIDTPFVPIYKLLFLFSHFLRKIVSEINVSFLCINITKLSFVCMCNKFDFIFQDKLIVLIRNMFMRKIINTSSNLKKSLCLGQFFSQMSV